MGCRTRSCTISLFLLISFDSNFLRSNLSSSFEELSLGKNCFLKT